MTVPIAGSTRALSMPAPAPALPAAVTVHHAYRGGLLEHILKIMEVASFLADAYGARRDLVIAGFSGRFRNLRLVGAGFLALLFFGTSWINWNGHQAILWDLDTRQFHVFGTTFWPQDFYLLLLLLISAALSLFVITTLAGRLWCGYTCPQTVWTEVFLWMERWSEGDRGRSG